MRLLFGLLTCFLLNSQSFAQAICSQDSLLNTKGVWIKGGDWTGLTTKYSQSDKQAMVKIQDKIMDLIFNAYPQPRGMQATWNHQYWGTPPLRSSLEGYGLTTYLMELYCDRDKKKLLPASETWDILNVFVNHWAGIFDFDTSLRIGKYAVALLPFHGEKVKGFDLLHPGNIRVNSSVYFICRPGESIYTELTRKQYLQALKGKLQREEKYQIARVDSYSKNDLQKASSEKYYHDSYDPQIKYIDDYLARASEDELSKTAIINRNTSFKEFTTEEKGGQIPIIINQAYFAKPPQNLYTPQFIVVQCTWNDGEGPVGGLLRPHPPDMNVCCKVSKFYKESIEQRLDLQALQQMLDK
jgi:hypothetical protein